jgi:hypothetical protein
MEVMIILASSLLILGVHRGVPTRPPLVIFSTAIFIRLDHRIVVH